MNTNITNFRQNLDSFCQLPTPTFSQGATTSNSSGKHLELHVFGIIGSLALNDKTVLQAIKAAGDVDQINVLINSVGGAFSAGLAIYNILREHPARIVTRNQGYCLSMASLVLMAGDEVQCCDNALTMLHLSQGLSLGDHRDHSKMAEVQQQHDKSLVSTYAKRLKLSDSKIMQLLSDESWYTSSEALKAGLVDKVTDSATLDREGAESGASDLVMSKFKNPPGAFRASQSVYS